MSIYRKEVNFSQDAVTSQLAENQTYASPITFRLQIDSLKYPNVEFNIQSASIPEIRIDFAPLSTPQRQIGIAADNVEYSPLELSFLVDENLINYYEIHDWMFGLTGEKDQKDPRKERDISLLVLNSHNNVAREVKFVDAHPIALSTLEFDAKNTSVDYLVANVSFVYSYFKLR